MKTLTLVHHPGGGMPSTRIFLDPSPSMSLDEKGVHLLADDLGAGVVYDPLARIIGLRARTPGRGNGRPGAIPVTDLGGYRRARAEGWRANETEGAAGSPGRDS